MKTLIIDNLTQTFDGTVVRSGLQRSSFLDATAFAEYHDTTFAYCGIELQEKFKNLILSDIGAKDVCLRDGESTKKSFIHIRKFIDKLDTDYDFIICHCHSVSMLNSINDKFDGKRIIFIIHDVLDLTYLYGLSRAVEKMRRQLKNDIKIYTNSQYSINKANHIYSRRKNFDVLSGDDIFNGFIKHFIWTKETPEIVMHNNHSSVIGRFEPDKYHHKLYKYKNPNHEIIHFGIRDEIRDKGLKYYERLKKSANAYKEGLGDLELKGWLMYTKNIIIPCWHEGFGFTAFEAGIYGARPIILHNDSPSQINEHATDEFLTRAGVEHVTIGFSNTEKLFEEINKLDTYELRQERSKALIEYFTLKNYVEERLNIFIN